MDTLNESTSNENCDKNDVDSISISSTSSASSSTSSLKEFPEESLFSNDVRDLMDYFEVEVDCPFIQDNATVYSALITLPISHIFGTRHLIDSSNAGNKIPTVCLLRVSATFTKDDNAGKPVEKYEYLLEEGERGNCAFAISGRDQKVDLGEYLKKAIIRSRNSSKRPKNQPPTILSTIESFYFLLETDINSARREIIVRDFCYPIHDPRHWGRSLKGQLERLIGAGNGGGNGIWKAKARYTFDAVSEGELSIRENDILLILANLGNGWLSARRLPSSPNPPFSDDSGVTNNRENEPITGLVPENYVQRI